MKKQVVSECSYMLPATSTSNISVLYVIHQVTPTKIVLGEGDS